MLGLSNLGKPGPSAIKNRARVDYTPVELLQRANVWIDAKDITTGDEQTLPNRGTDGGTATIGSTTGSDTNDPVLLPHSGEHYIWMPGSAGNRVTQTGATMADVAGTADVNQYFRVSVPSTVPNLNSVGGFWRDNASITDCGGLRWQSAASIGLLWKDGSLTTRSVNVPHGHAAGDVVWFRVRYVYADPTNANATKWYLDTSAEDVAHWSDVTTWTNLGTYAHGSAEALAPTTPSLPWTVGNLPNVNNARNGIGSFYYGSFTVGGGAEQGVFAPANDINTSGDPDAGQSSWTSSTGETWTVSRGTTGSRAHVVTRPVAVSDGVDDYMTIPFTPSYTASAGALTVLWAGRIPTGMAAFDRLVSFESVSVNGLLIAVTSGAEKFGVWSGHGAASVNRQLTSGENVNDNKVRWCAAVVDNGTLAAYTADDSAAPIALSASDPSFLQGRVLGQAFTAGQSAPAAAGQVVVFDGVALSQNEIEAVANKIIAGSYS